MKLDEADLLFSGKISNAEAELIFGMQRSGLSTNEKLAVRKQFRAADKAGKCALLDKFCGVLTR